MRDVKKENQGPQAKEGKMRNNETGGGWVDNKDGGENKRKRRERERCQRRVVRS